MENALNALFEIKPKSVCLVSGDMGGERVGVHSKGWEEEQILGTLDRGRQTPFGKCEIKHLTL